jgi:hypothetical protein
MEQGNHYITKHRLGKDGTKISLFHSNGAYTIELLPPRGDKLRPNCTACKGGGWRTWLLQFDTNDRSSFNKHKLGWISITRYTIACRDNIQLVNEKNRHTYDRILRKMCFQSWFQAIEIHMSTTTPSNVLWPFRQHMLLTYAPFVTILSKHI